MATLTTLVQPEDRGLKRSTPTTVWSDRKGNRTTVATGRHLQGRLKKKGYTGTSLPPMVNMEPDGMDLL